MITHLAEDFRQPQRDIVRAMVWGCLVVGDIYVATNMMLLLFLTGADIAIMGVAETKLGDWAAALIGFLGVAGGMAPVNVYLTSLSRLLACFADQDVLPSVLGKKNNHGMPVSALACIFVVIGLMLLLTFVSSLDLVFFYAKQHSLIKPMLIAQERSIGD